MAGEQTRPAPYPPAARSPSFPNSRLLGARRMATISNSVGNPRKSTSTKSESKYMR